MSEYAGGSDDEDQQNADPDEDDTAEIDDGFPGTLEEVAPASGLWFAEVEPPHPEVPPAVGFIQFPEHDGAPQWWRGRPRDLVTILEGVEAIAQTEDPETYGQGHGHWRVLDERGGSLLGQFTFRADDWPAVVAFLRDRVARYRQRAPLRSGVRPYYGDLGA